jgi:hypothetical protein
VPTDGDQSTTIGYIISFKDGTPMEEIRRVASQMEADNGAKITHFYEAALVGFSMQVPAATLRDALESLHKLPSVQIVEMNQRMGINPPKDS